MSEKGTDLKSLIDLFLKAAIAARYAAYDRNPLDAYFLLSVAQVAEDAARALSAMMRATAP